MTRRKKVTGFLIVPCLALVGVPWALQNRASQDSEYAKFYNAGKTVNDFLKSYCKGIESTFTSADAAEMDAFYSDGYSVAGRGRIALVRDESVADVAARHFGVVGKVDYGRTEIHQELASYIGGMISVDETICKINLIETLEPEREMTLTVKIYLDGRDLDGDLFQDRMFYRWWIVNEAGPDQAINWRIARDELIQGVRVVGDGSMFADTDPRALGIDFEHRRDPKLDMKAFRDELEFGVIQHASGGLSAADYDGDGWADLFFLGGETSRLYRNEGLTSEGGPRFEDVTERSGLAGIDQAHVALFADFDNDNDRDLFVGRYLVASRYYRNDGGGRFTDATAEIGLDLVEPVTSATLLDFDLDGDLDIYLAVNGQAFEAFPRLPFFARNGEPNRLLRNDEGTGFTDVTAASGTGDSGWSLAVASSDVDQDGWPDLAVANDFGRKSLYRNLGDGTFQDITKQAGVLDFSGGMGLAFGDFDDDGLVDLYTSNINSNQRWFGEDMTVSQYMRNVMSSRWALSDLGEYWDLYRLIGKDWTELGQQIGEGNSLFRNLGRDADSQTAFEEYKDSQTHRAGWSWSVAFFDTDNDTDLDLYAANGWISNTPGTDL